MTTCRLRRPLVLYIALIAFFKNCSAFVVPYHAASGRGAAVKSSSSSSSSSQRNMMMLPDFLISTIDSDIANIPDNEFAPVFFGGIVVMFGGLLSALFVGFILESRDLYANVVADSYAQAGANDEEFWKGLSEEEKKKTQELLKRMKDSNRDGVDALTTLASRETEETPKKEKQEVEIPKAVDETSKKETKSESSKEAGMFSDY